MADQEAHTRWQTTIRCHVHIFLLRSTRKNLACCLLPRSTRELGLLPIAYCLFVLAVEAKRGWKRKFSVEGEEDGG